MDERELLLERAVKARVELGKPRVVVGISDTCDEAHPLANLTPAERIRSREHVIASVLADVLRAEQAATRCKAASGTIATI